MKDCEIGEKRFDKPIKRTAVLDFASDCIKKIQKIKDGDKQALIRMERDIFGGLFSIAMKKEIDINACLSFSFAPAPPALFQYSGEIHKTDKSAFGKLLRSKIKSEPPTFVDIEVIDGFYFLHLCGNSLPQTFGKVAESVLCKICNTSAREIHIVFDR